MKGNLSTMIIGGRASQEEHDRAVNAMEERGAVLELCHNCGATLDVSECSPMTETTCPNCGGLLKVLTKFHHFALMNVLGRGGAGIVFRAFDETLERDVALKLLRNEHTRNPQYTEELE